MTTRTTKTRRRRPKQARSRFTWDAILTAATQVFVHDGYEDTTTKRIAEVAGVGAGSLYQYFRNKHDLVAALAEQELDRFFQLFTERLAAQPDASLEIVLDGYIRSVLSIYRDEAELHQILIMHAPLALDMEESHRIDRRATQLVETFLQRRHDDLCTHDKTLVAFMAVTTVRYTTLAWARERPSAINEDELARALVSMLLGWMRTSS